MASTVVLKGVPLPGYLKELLAAPSVPEKSIAACPRCLFCKGAPFHRYSDSDDDTTTTEESSGEVTDDDLRRALGLSAPKLFSTDSLDLYAEPSKLLKLLAGMEGGGAAAASGTGSSGHGWWVSKEDDDAMLLKVAMPGLGKEHVKVSAEKNILVIKGEDGDGKGPAARYSRRIQLPAEAFKMDQIKAEMNNGVLKVTLPKIKDEERKDVFQIKVE